MTTGDVVRTRPVVSDTVPHNKLQYDQKKPIGCGAFGAVYKAIHKNWGCLVAYKKLGIQFITEEDCIIALKNEAEIHRQLRHPHVVSMLGVVFEDGDYGLVLEYIMYRSLDAFLGHIKKLTGSQYCGVTLKKSEKLEGVWNCIPGATFLVSSVLKTRMSYQVCCGMSYLHNLRPMPIIHGDLKMQNLLVGEHLNVKADVYSFGILLWELFTEVQAFETSKNIIISLVKSGERPSLKKLPGDVVPAIKAHMLACWEQEPEKRPSFTVLATELRSLIHGSKIEIEIERSIDDVLTVYHGSFDRTRPKSEHGHKFEKVSQQLCASIRRTDQILIILVERRAISRDDFESIRHDQPSVLVCTQRLIDVLNDKPLTAFECFLDALVATNQSHLCALLNDEGAEIIMDHREALIDNYTYLKANLNVTNTSLLDHLLQSLVLDKQEIDEIHAKKTEHESVDQLLHFIMRTSLEQYELFVRALRESNLTFIAEQLLIRNGALAEPQTAVCLSATVLQMGSHHTTLEGR